MNVSQFWEFIKKIDEAIKENEATALTGEKFESIVENVCSAPLQQKILSEIYEYYHQRLYEKYANDLILDGEKGILAEDSYHMFITYLITLGRKTVKRLMDSASVEIGKNLKGFKNNYYKLNLHIYLHELKLKNLEIKGTSSYKIYELTADLKKAVENSLK